MSAQSADSVHKGVVRPSMNAHRSASSYPSATNNCGGNQSCARIARSQGGSLADESKSSILAELRPAGPRSGVGSGEDREAARENGTPDSLSMVMHRSSSPSGGWAGVDVDLGLLLPCAKSSARPVPAPSGGTEAAACDELDELPAPAVSLGGWFTEARRSAKLGVPPLSALPAEGEPVDVGGLLVGVP